MSHLEREYKAPLVLSHQGLKFETAHSWNPGCGKDPASNGNDGKNYPPSNPNGSGDTAGKPGGHICNNQNS